MRWWWRHLPHRAGQNRPDRKAVLDEQLTCTGREDLERTSAHLQEAAGRLDGPMPVRTPVA